jgi:hypothetical protein
MKQEIKKMLDLEIKKMLDSLSMPLFVYKFQGLGTDARAVWLEKMTMRQGNGSDGSRP